MVVGFLLYPPTLSGIYIGEVLLQKRLRKCRNSCRATVEQQYKKKLLDWSSEKVYRTIMGNSCQCLPSGDSIGPRYVLQLLFSEN